MAAHSSSGPVNWVSCVGLIVTLVACARLLTSASVWLALLRWFDQEQDGDIELAEVVGLLVGKALGLAAFGAMQCHRYTSILVVVASFVLVYALGESLGCRCAASGPTTHPRMCPPSPSPISN